ncbi:hypothetical protein HDU67_010396 [Dinochytrium kinnereticum]|nr:hypothetical protein HDU67_010396 [Dinochytrium kinnereticum]
MPLLAPSSRNCSVTRDPKPNPSFAPFTRDGNHAHPVIGNCAWNQRYRGNMGFMPPPVGFFCLELPSRELNKPQSITKEFQLNRPQRITTEFQLNKPQSITKEFQLNKPQRITKEFQHDQAPWQTS